MGRRIKSKPQPLIHLKCSSSAGLREGDGPGETKSSRLKPFHLGSLLVMGFCSAIAFFSARDKPAVISAAFFRNDLRFIMAAFSGKKVRQNDNGFLADPGVLSRD